MYIDSIMVESFIFLFLKFIVMPYSLNCQLCKF